MRFRSTIESTCSGVMRFGGRTLIRPSRSITMSVVWRSAPGSKRYSMSRTCLSCMSGSSRTAHEFIVTILRQLHDLDRDPFAVGLEFLDAAFGDLGLEQAAHPLLLVRVLPEVDAADRLLQQLYHVFHQLLELALVFRRHGTRGEP